MTISALLVNSIASLVRRKRSPRPSSEPRSPRHRSSDASPVGGPHAVTVKDLSVSFADNQALKGVSLEVPQKAVTAIIGPSGCGKSTFLRCLNRMHDLVPTACVQGEIRLFGQEILNGFVEPETVRRRVGMVFQKPNPFPTMSIAENVTVGPRLNGKSDRAELAEKMHKALTASALWDEVKDRLAEPAVSLSGGQQQRLCIARALAVEPELLLLDEPASALDPIATAKIEDLICTLKHNFTVIIVTHNLQQAARISDFTGFFYLGVLVEFDSTRKIFGRPSKKQTEEYVTGKFG